MIDLHCHILPGLDDGPETLGEAVEMCRIAAADGITTVVATPHYKPGTYEHPSVQIMQRLEQLQRELDEQNIELRLFPGADVAVTPELAEAFAQYEHLTINRTGRYFLAELPHETVPHRWDRYLLSFLRQGKTPILTHPERNAWFLNHQEALYPFVRGGGLVQVTAMSITGGCGMAARDFCRYLLEQDLVHVIASDAHSAGKRQPVLSEAFVIASQWIGKETARRLVDATPMEIIEGRKVVLSEPTIRYPKKRSWLQRLILSS